MWDYGKILLLVKETALEQAGSIEALRARKNYREKDIESAIRGDAAHHATLAQVRHDLDSLGLVYDEVNRSDLRSVKGYGFIVTNGGDGTFLLACQHLQNKKRRSVPVLGVNSDTDQSVGFFSSATINTFGEIMEAIDTFPRSYLSRLEISINDHILPQRALNEVIFWNENIGNTLCYIRENGIEERVKEGYMVIATTPAGSTAGFRNLGGPLVSLDEKRIAYGINGCTYGKDPFGFADTLSIEPLKGTGRLTIDGATTYPVTSSDKISIRYGSRITMIGSLEENRKAHGFA
ncbi:MAG: hypothetical protein HGA85_01680 [Nanoarchaeota archaeon]|nr:hypothetical protein [Nanoarchaeota archaeon]